MTHIGLFAPAGYIAQTAHPALARACDYFKAQGCSVTLAPHALTRAGRFAASAADRLADLDFLLADPSIDVWLALRGGYGSSELLPQLPFAALKRATDRGLKICGHSDINTLQLAGLAQANIPSYVGPMALFDFGAETINPLMAQYFWRMVNQEALDVRFASPQPYPAQTLSGRLLGGNLTVFTHLLGSPYLPAIADGILFFEDINEHPYRIERMLFQLLHTGVLARQKAVLLGDFSGYRLTDYDQGYDFEAMLARMRGYCPIPILTGLPFGHCHEKITLKLGAPVELRLETAHCALSYR